MYGQYRKADVLVSCVTSAEVGDGRKAIVSDIMIQSISKGVCTKFNTLGSHLRS